MSEMRLVDGSDCLECIHLDMFDGKGCLKHGYDNIALRDGVRMCGDYVHYEEYQSTAGEYADMPTLEGGA